MKKKVTKKVQATKKQTKLSFADQVLMSISLMVLIGALGFIGYTAYKFITPSITGFFVGDCVMRRDYSVAKITAKYSYLGEYGLVSQTPKDSIFGGWYLADADGARTIYRDIDLANQYYIKVPCNTNNK